MCAELSCNLLHYCTSIQVLAVDLFHRLNTFMSVVWQCVMTHSGLPGTGLHTRHKASRVQPVPKAQDCVILKQGGLMQVLSRILQG